MHVFDTHSQCLFILTLWILYSATCPSKLLTDQKYLIEYKVIQKH